VSVSAPTCMCACLCVCVYVCVHVCVRACVLRKFVRKPVCASVVAVCAVAVSPPFPCQASSVCADLSDFIREKAFWIASYCSPRLCRLSVVVTLLRASLRCALCVQRLPACMHTCSAAQPTPTNCPLAHLLVGIHHRLGALIRPQQRGRVCERHPLQLDPAALWLAGE
jgi:hypothetical protein